MKEGAEDEGYVRYYHSIYNSVAELKEAGIENILALRGDLTPELAAGDRSGLDYRNAVDLIREIRELSP